MRREHKEYCVAVGAEPADRPIAPLRGDLLVSPQLYYGQLCFVIKDPVTLRYYRLQPVEHFLVTQFDGQKTARVLLGILQQQFPEGSLGVQDVLRFVAMLHESHLLVGQGQGHAQWLTKRRAAARRRRGLELLQNFLFFKMAVFNPDRVLNVLHKTIGRLIYTRAAGVLSLLLVGVALLNVLAHLERFGHMTYSLLSPQNLLVLYAVFTVTKVFHEFGHGLTARHFGGEVSAMGVMLFVVTPSFYCDTSDAWMIPSRAARLWINAGGVVVEMVLAALASCVWLYTPDNGLLNQIAVNIMISCSVATLFFNANPLLRYDGYYFLADWLEVPNLMTKGRQFIGYFLQKYLLGLKPVLPPDATRAGWLVAYAAAATVYRWMVVLGIIALLYTLFDRVGMGPIGIMLAVLYVVLTIVWPLGRTMAFLWKQRWDIYRRLATMAVAGTAATAVMAGLAFLPVNNAIIEPLVVLSDRDEPVFVRAPGYVEAVAHDAGELVKAGEVIVRLKDPMLATLLEQARNRRQQAELVAQTAAAENKPALLAAAREQSVQFDEEIGLLEQRMNDLVLKAPVDGVIIRETSLRQLTGNYVPAGLKLCRVIDTQHLQARISLPQQQAARVREGMPVRIRLWCAPEAEMHTTVTRVSAELSDQLLHPALAATRHGDVDVQPDSSPMGMAAGGVRASGRRSTLIMELPAAGGPGSSNGAGLFLADGMTGRGRIEFPRTTVVSRLWRMLLDSTTPDWRL
jgi:putative peptide zinc metalloprotease protein